MRDVFEGLAGIRNEFFHLVQVDFAIGVDGGFAVGLAVEHVLVYMGIEFDVTALGLEFHIVQVKAVLVLVDCTARVLDL